MTDFSYQRTFLRSALAKDPFALGDLGPQDVLRIESEFPDLFNSTNSPKKAENVARTLIPPNVTVRQRCSVPIPPSIVTQPVRSTIANNVVRGNGLALQQTKKRPNINPPKTTRLLTTCPRKPSLQHFSASPARMQYVSIEELRRVLKEFLQDKKPDLKHGELLHFRDEKRGKTIAHESENMKRLIQADTTDIRKRSKETICLNQGAGDVRGTLLENTSPLNQVACTSPTTTSRHNRNEFRQIIPKIRPSPGFIKPVPSQLGHNKEKNKTNYSTASRTAEKNRVIVKDNKNSKPSFSSPQSQKMSHMVYEKNNDDNVSPIKTKKDTSQETCQIDVKGNKLEPRDNASESSTTESANDPTDPFLSYQQLKFAKNLATAYEKMGLLQKKASGVSKSLPDAKTNSFDDKMVQTTEEIVLTPLENMGEAESQPDSDILETLAKELIYLEIMKHLQSNYKVMAENSNYGTRQEEHHNFDCKSSYNHENPLTNMNIEELILGRLSVIQEITELELITPTLSTSSSHPLDSIGFDLDVIPTPETPEVSSSRISRRAQCAVKESPGNINDYTDCSDISDFAISFSENEHVFRTPPPRPPELKSPTNSSDFTTPQLSISSTTKRPHKSPSSVQNYANIHYKQDTVYISSPSTPSNSSKGTPSKSNPRIPQRKQVIRHISEALIQQSHNKDSSEGLTSTPKTNKERPSEQVEQEPSNVHDLLDHENESFTLSELLSEGEFIGKVSKSLGEITPLRQIARPLLFQSSANSCSINNSVGSTVYFISQEESSASLQSSQQGTATAYEISQGEFLGTSPIYLN